MRIVALYLEKHFLFEEPQTINFGGIYFYTFIDSTTVIREKNMKFIENFYSDNTIQLVSAIVGKNGTGKTTILKVLIDILQKRLYNFSNYTAIFEEGENTYISTTYFTHERKLDTSFDYEPYVFNSQTIYYSPFLDFKDPVNGIDLSYDRILENDLDGIDDMYTANDLVIPSRRLKMKNSLRQLEFQYSEYGERLKNEFSYPNYNRSRFTFTRHKIDVDSKTDKINFWNTPRAFQRILQLIYKIIRDEADRINRDRPKGYSLVNLQKRLLKNYILMDILCLFIKQMEKSNDNLEEGHLIESYDILEKKLKEQDAKDAFFTFLDAHAIKYRGSKKFNPILPIEPTKDLIHELFVLIDNLKAENDRDNEFFDWSEKAIYLSKDDTENVIKLHNKFITEVDKYYKAIKDNGELLFSRTDRIEGVLNFEPSDRSLSSGENALLNFYSRIYDHFKRNIIDLPTEKKYPYYFIFLDEADLGFHPRWKKQFVSSILLFLENFFKSKPIEAKIQIIFTTHDSLTLSDIPNYNIIYLTEEDGNRRILLESEKPRKSFGANITELLADSFFVGNGLIGDFAKTKIDQTIDWLKNNETTDNSKYHELLIRNIDEPIIQKKLSEMYDDKVKSEISKDLLKQQIEYLQEQYDKKFRL